MKVLEGDPAGLALAASEAWDTMLRGMQQSAVGGSTGERVTVKEMRGAVTMIGAIVAEYISAQGDRATKN